MAQEVTNASLTRNLLETSNEGTVCVPVMTKRICRTPSTLMPPTFDPRAKAVSFSVWNYYQGSPWRHLRDAKQQKTAVETSSVTLHVLNHRLGQRVGTVNDST